MLGWHGARDEYERDRRPNRRTSQVGETGSGHLRHAEQSNDRPERNESTPENQRYEVARSQFEFTLLNLCLRRCQRKERFARGVPRFLERSIQARNHLFFFFIDSMLKRKRSKTTGFEELNMCQRIVVVRFRSGNGLSSIVPGTLAALFLRAQEIAGVQIATLLRQAIGIVELVLLLLVVILRVGFGETILGNCSVSSKARQSHLVFLRLDVVVLIIENHIAVVVVRSRRIDDIRILGNLMETF